MYNILLLSLSLLSIKNEIRNKLRRKPRGPNPGAASATRLLPASALTHILQRFHQTNIYRKQITPFTLNLIVLLLHCWRLEVMSTPFWPLFSLSWPKHVRVAGATFAEFLFPWPWGAWAGPGPGSGHLCNVWVTPHGSNMSDRARHWPVHRCTKTFANNSSSAVSRSHRLMTHNHKRVCMGC